MQKVIKNAKKNQPKIDRDLFLSTEICETPQGVKLTLKEIERIYSDHYPEWNQNLQCFPQGPIFSDKLFTTQPYINAKDIEDRKNHLRSKIKALSNISIDKGYDISKDILQSLEPVIIELKLNSNHQILNGLSKILNGKLKGKQDVLQNGDHKSKMDTLMEVQDELFDLILENDKIFKLYEMR